MGRTGRVLGALALAAGGIAIGSGLRERAAADIDTGDRLVYVPLDQPCRLADTRATTNVGPRATPLGPGETFAFNGTGPTGECLATDLPADAAALSLNVTAIDATTLTFLTFWPDGPLPLAASLNPSPGQPPTPNAVKVNLSATGSFLVYNDVGSVDVVIDVDGYFAHHTHDDLYTGGGGDAETVDGWEASWLAPRATGAGPAPPGPVCFGGDCAADVLLSSIVVPRRGLLVYDAYVDLERFAGTANDHVSCSFVVDGDLEQTTQIQLDPDPNGAAGEETDCSLTGFTVVEEGTHTLTFRVWDVRDTETRIGAGLGSLWAMWVPVDGGTGVFFEDL